MFPRIWACTSPPAGAQAAAAGVRHPGGSGMQSEASGVMGTSFYISPEIEQVRRATMCHELCMVVLSVKPHPESAA